MVSCLWGRPLEPTLGAQQQQAPLMADATGLEDDAAAGDRGPVRSFDEQLPLNDLGPPPASGLAPRLARDVSTEAKKIAASVCKGDYMAMFIEKEDLKRRMRLRQVTLYGCAGGGGCGQAHAS
jgi:hypothetical protein